MAHAAQHAREDPDRVSFVAALRIVRQSVAQQGAFPPEHPGAADAHWHAVLRRILDRLNPIRRCRSAPRVIKRKMPKWHVKRAAHAHWPQPQHSPDITVHPP